MKGSLLLLVAIAAAAPTPHLRRLLPGIPDKVDVPVPCTNTTVCGINGECRADICKCDPGWSSPTLAAPCSAQGPAQLKMALLQYFFGWFGLPAFLLGWDALGIATVVCLVLLCCSGCLWVAAEDAASNVMISPAEDGEAQRKKQELKAKYERRQVGALCLGTGFCCAWFWLWVVLSVFISLSAHCVTSSGAPCKGWRRL
jgi:hypothetical protein